MSQLFAAAHPERVERVVLLNTFVSPRYRRRMLDFVQEGDPPIKTLEELYGRFEGLIRSWSEDPRYMVDWEMPSQSGNEAFIRWIGRLERFSASPRDFRRQFESVWSLDAGDAPERIQAPTLVMHTRGDDVLPVAGGRLLAELIPGAQYYEIPGHDHFAWIMPHWRDFTDHMLQFLTGRSVERTTKRQFATVL